ncbi:phage tail protein [Frigidibacter sp. MR17.24]|uniref:phage tail protein n=1 Tax=Frigidibacter sp. MR17.24 TaxID=3127345 RepID=UPI003012D938
MMKMLRGTTMLSPNARILRDPISGAIITALGVSSTGVAASLIGVGVSLAVSAVTSWALSALTPKPKIKGLGDQGSQGLLVNEREAAGPHQIVYGRARKGGTVTFMATTGSDNRYLHQIICLAGHEIDAVEQIYIDDEPVELTSNSAWQYEYDIYRIKVTRRRIGGGGEGGGGDNNNYVEVRELVYVETRVSKVAERYLEVGARVENRSQPQSADGENAFTGMNDGSYAIIKRRIAANGLVGGKWRHRIRIFSHLGSPTQAADGALLSEVPGLDGNFRGQGIAYLYVRFDYDADVFPNGVPLITAGIRGRKVYNPTNGQTQWSENAALCIRDYIVGSHGLGDPDVNDTAFSVAAYLCAEAVTVAGGGQIARYAANGVINADASIGDVIQQMMTCCAGTLFYGGGEWQLRPGYYSAPILDLGLDDLRSAISVQTRGSMGEAVNSVQGTFNDAGQAGVTVDYPAVSSDLFLAEDGGVPAALNLDLPFTRSSAAAQRLAKITLYRAREQITVSADFGLRALACQVGDIVSLTVDRYGWAAKEFEVQGWRFFVDGDAGDLRVSMTLREISASVFAWDADEREMVANNTRLSAVRPDAPGISLTSELRVVNEQVVSVMIIDLSSTDDQLLEFEVAYRDAASSRWVAAGLGQSPRFEVVLPGDGYFDVRAKARSALGFGSDWSEVLDWYSGVFSLPPANVTGFAANVVGGTLHLSWDAVADLDLSHYKIRYSPKLAGATYQDAMDIVPKVPRPATSTSIAAASGTYWIKAVDKSGNVSAAAAVRAVSVDLAAVSALNVVEVIQEAPAFSGAQSGVAVTSDDIGTYIQLATNGTWDDQELEWDEIGGLWDFGGGLVSVGSYEFAEVIDLGEVYTSRVSVSAEVQYLNVTDGTWDDQGGMWDSLTTPFDGDAASVDTTSVRLQVSQSNGDPGGGAVWTEWQDLVAADVTARALRFRALLTSRDPAATPIIRSLSARIDMPDRVEDGDDIAVTGTLTVAFPAAFRQPPTVGLNFVGAVGDRAAVTARAAAGFTVTVRNSAGAVSTSPGTIDYIAKGYGRVQ